MALFLLQQSNRKDYNYKEYVLDTEADVASLPVNDAPGSKAFVIATSKTYMLNTQKQWVAVTI